MSRCIVPVTILAMVLVAPLSAGQKEREKPAAKPPAHVVLHDELLQEQQTLQRLQTEWLLQLLKTKQRLDKAGTEAAKQESAICAKLLESARELPGLYEAAIARLENSSLTNVAATEKTLKATKRLSDELHRACAALQKAPKGTFATERSADEKFFQLWTALGEASGRNRAAELLDTIEKRRDPKALGQMREFFKSQEKVCEQLFALYADAQDGAKAARLKKLLAKDGLFDQIDASLAVVEPPPVGPPGESPAPGRSDALLQLRKELKELQGSYSSLPDAASRIIVVVGLRQLADRQQRLHDRLQKQRDEVVTRLLEGIE